MSNKNDKLSIFISLVLRHRPEIIDINIDEYGYANVNELIKGINKSGRFINAGILEDIVKSDKKSRYSFNLDKSKIRANQGHSISVNVELKEALPPMYLYHGTAKANLDSILESGIRKMNRLYVHFSEDIDTALQVGSRHGTPIVLKINTTKMKEDGYQFYLSKNNVWLVDFVPNSYIGVKL